MSKEGWSVGTVLTIIGLLIAAGFFHSSNIVRVRSIGSDSTCPTSIDRDFDVKFINHGSKDTSLCVTAFSDELNFTKNSDCLYMAHNAQSETQFSLEIDEESFPDYNSKSNITIIYNYNYKKNFFQTKNLNVTCDYEKKERSNNLQLIS